MIMNPGSQIMTYPEGFSAGEREFFAAIKVTITSTTVAPDIGKCNKNKVPILGGSSKARHVFSGHLIVAVVEYRSHDAEGYV